MWRVQWTHAGSAVVECVADEAMDVDECKGRWSVYMCVCIYVHVHVRASVCMCVCVTTHVIESLSFREGNAHYQDVHAYACN